MKNALKGLINGLSKLQLLSFEKVVIIYLIFTSFIIIFNHNILPDYNHLLLVRLYFAVGLFALVYLSSLLNSKFLIFLRYAYIALSLIYWYPETFDINRIFNNLDYKLANWEQMLFGFQPALVLNQLITSSTFNEMVHFGYFAYYPIMVFVGFYILWKDSKNIEHYLFTLCIAFFSYYLFFICFPTAGPQYYFPAIGMENALAGNFPNIYHYFNQNAHLAITEKSSGLFFNLVEYSQQVGERPTAAFPSSHVGITTVIMLFLFFNRHLKLALLLMPVYLILVFSTVYIQAHYAIDVFAGLISAYLLYYLSKISYPVASHRFELNNFVYEKVKIKIALEKKV